MVVYIEVVVAKVEANALSRGVCDLYQFTGGIAEDFDDRDRRVGRRAVGS